MAITPENLRELVSNPDCDPWIAQSQFDTSAFWQAVAKLLEWRSGILNANSEIH